MAQEKYITLSEEALAKLCGLIRESHSIADAIDDENIATNSTYSSAKLQELLGKAGAQAVELTYAEYQALSEEEKENGTIYFISDVDNDGTITGYTGGTGITVSEDRIIAIKDIKKNYIDNSNFRINQTGQSEYTVTDTTPLYTVDRWYIDGGTLTVMENGVQFTNPNTESGSSNLVRLKQNIGYSFTDFAGKTVTLSAKINNTIYKGTATIPTEKPTEGTAVQYIAGGIADFGINLNYSITGDYFVPYFALAYNKTIVIEWMKLEVNSEFSSYVEPDYTTELIKINMTTVDKGALNLPYTRAESDTLKSDITLINTALGDLPTCKNKLVVPAWTNNTVTLNGLTFVKNDDQTITVTGTSTSASGQIIGKANLLAGETYTFTALPNQSYQFYKGSTYVKGIVNDETLEITEDAEYVFKFYFATNKEFNITLSPMVRLKSILDSTFEPYSTDIDTRLDELATPMTGATTSADGASGLVPTPEKGNVKRILRADGSWVLPSLYPLHEKADASVITAGSSLTIDSINNFVELWIFRDTSPNYERVFLINESAQGVYWSEIACLCPSTGTDKEQYINIELTQGSYPTQVIITNNNTSTSTNIQLYRYAIN